MFEKPQFHIETVETGLNYGRYKVEPLEPGYGTTLGNALRRILLRSLEGVADFARADRGVWHEFATINNVREDVVEIVLNLKRVRLKRVTEFNGETRAHLYVPGRQFGRASSHRWRCRLAVRGRVINPDQVIATLTGRMRSSIWISGSPGSGLYRPAEHPGDVLDRPNSDRRDLHPGPEGQFVVEHTRVGPVTDFDRLIMEILTDGTIEPDEALGESARILMTKRGSSPGSLKETRPGRGCWPVHLG